MTCVTSSASTPNLSVCLTTLLNDAGDDTSLLFYVPTDFKPVLQAGESLVLFCPAGTADYEINALIPRLTDCSLICVAETLYSRDCIEEIPVIQ